MSPRSIQNLSKIGACALLALLSLSPARADIHSMAEDAHHDLEKALNPGGDPPSDAERTSLINSALDLMKNFPPIRRERRVIEARDSLKAALEEIKNGDPDHAAANDIRDADSIIRDLESAS